MVKEEKKCAECRLKISAVGESADDNMCFRKRRVNEYRFMGKNEQNKKL
jgi:hypothetical protein